MLLLLHEEHEGSIDLITDSCKVETSPDISPRPKQEGMEGGSPNGMGGLGPLHGCL